MEAILKHYPKALPLHKLEQEITSRLNMSGFILSRTIWGVSICSDEVNNSFNRLGRLFAGLGPFHFGGISGLPFTGMTGMVAFSEHIPDDGCAFLLYGPHIGISKDGEVGKVLRERQKKLSTCCGSLVAGLSNLDAKTAPNVHDYQQTRVQNMLFDEKDRLEGSSNQIKEATEIAFSQNDEELKLIIENLKDFLAEKKLYTMGGILINTDWDKEDWFDIRKTELLEFI